MNSGIARSVVYFALTAFSLTALVPSTKLIVPVVPNPQVADDDLPAPTLPTKPKFAVELPTQVADDDLPAPTLPTKPKFVVALPTQVADDDLPAPTLPTKPKSGLEVDTTA
jgi:hypothetical protein